MVISISWKCHNSKPCQKKCLTLALQGSFQIQDQSVKEEVDGVSWRIMYADHDVNSPLLE